MFARHFSVWQGVGVRYDLGVVQERSEVVSRDWTGRLVWFCFDLIRIFFSAHRNVRAVADEDRTNL